PWRPPRRLGAVPARGSGARANPRSFRWVRHQCRGLPCSRCAVGRDRLAATGGAVPATCARGGPRFAAGAAGLCSNSGSARAARGGGAPDGLVIIGPEVLMGVELMTSLPAIPRTSKAKPRKLVHPVTLKSLAYGNHNHFMVFSISPLARSACR